jgi:hypothetical protein
MKSAAILVLIVITLSSLLPGRWGVTTCTSEEQTLATLDVCHSSTPVVSQELPSITTSLILLPAPRIAGVSQVLTISAKPLLIASQDERPPKTVS